MAQGPSAYDLRQARLRALRQAKLGKIPGVVSTNNRGTTYVVQNGDNLFSLAEKFGGSQFKAQSLANLIGFNPGSWDETGKIFTPGDTLRAGMTINIPKWFGGDWQGSISKGFISSSNYTNQYAQSLGGVGNVGNGSPKSYSGTAPTGQFPPLSPIALDNAYGTLGNIPGYDASYWQNPSNVVYWHNFFDTATEKTFMPDWLMAMAPAVNDAYTYMEIRNGGKNPVDWGYLPKEDPFFEYLGQLPTPPSTTFSNTGQVVNPTAEMPQPGYDAITNPKTPGFDWMALSDVQKDEIYKKIDNGEFDVADFDRNNLGLYLSDPKTEVWFTNDPNKPGLWQSISQYAQFQGMSNPWVSPAVQGLSVLLMTKGKWQFALPQVLLGYGAQLPGGWGETARDIGWVVNEAAQIIEQSAGVINQLPNVLSPTHDVPGPDRKDTYTEILKLFPEATSDEAAMYLRKLEHIKQINAEMANYPLEDRIKAAWAAGLVTWDTESPAPETPSTPRSVEVLGRKELKEVPIGYTQDDFRYRVLKGEDINSIYEDFARAYGASGVLMDFVLQSYLDPLNVVPEGTAYVRGKINEYKAAKYEAAGNIPRANIEKLWAQANELAPVFFGKETAQAFSALVRTQDLPTLKALTPWERLLTGIDENGREKAILPSKSKSWLRKMVSLPPHTKAIVAVRSAQDNLRVMMNWLVPDETIGQKLYQTLEAVANNDPVALKKMGASFMNTPIFYTIIGAMKGFLPKLKELNANFELAKSQRERFWGIQKITGENPQKLFRAYTEGDPTVEFNRLKIRLELSDLPEAKVLLDDINNGVVTAASLADEFSIFKDNRVAIHPAEHKAIVMEYFTDHMGKWGVDYYKVAKVSQFEEVLRGLKAAQSLLLLDYSVGYLVNNFINNRIMMAAGGTLGLTPEWKIDRWLEKDFGVTPSRLEEGNGPTDLNLDGTPKKPGQKVSRETTGEKLTPAEATIADSAKGSGPATKVADAIGSVRKKGGLMGILSTMAEKSSSKQMYYSAMKSFWGSQWRPGKGFNRMPPMLENAVRAAGLDPRAFYDRIQGMIRPEDVDSLLSGISERSVDAYINDAAETMGQDAATASQMLHQLGVYDVLKEKIAKAKTDADVDQAFEDIKVTVNDRLAGIRANGLIAKAKHIANKIKAEGPAGAMEIFQELQNQIYQRKLENDQIWDEAYKKANDANNPGLRSQYLEQASRKNADAWKKMQDIEAATIIGIVDGLNMDNVDAQRMVESKIVQNEIYQAYFKAKNEAYQQFFRTTYKTKRQRAAAWAALEKEFNDRYYQAEGDVLKVQSDQDKIFVKMFGESFGINGEAMANNWRKNVLRISYELRDMINEFRRSTAGMTMAERDIAWEEFKPIYQAKWMERLKANEDGAGNLYKGDEPDPTSGPTQPGLPMPEGQRANQNGNQRPQPAGITPAQKPVVDWESGNVDLTTVTNDQIRERIATLYEKVDYSLERETIDRTSLLMTEVSGLLDELSRRADEKYGALQRDLAKTEQTQIDGTPSKIETPVEPTRSDIIEDYKTEKTVTEYENWKAKKEHAEDVWAMLNRYGIPTADKDGRPLPDAKWNALQLVREYGGYQGIQIQRFDDIPLDILSEALEEYHNSPHYEFNVEQFIKDMYAEKLVDGDQPFDKVVTNLENVKDTIIDQPVGAPIEQPQQITQPGSNQFTSIPEPDGTNLGTEIPGRDVVPGIFVYGNENGVNTDKKGYKKLHAVDENGIQLAFVDTTDYRVGTIISRDAAADKVYRPIDMVSTNRVNPRNFLEAGYDLAGMKDGGSFIIDIVAVGNETKGYHAQVIYGVIDENVPYQPGKFPGQKLNDPMEYIDSSTKLQGVFSENGFVDPRTNQPYTEANLGSLPPVELPPTQDIDQRLSDYQRTSKPPQRAIDRPAPYSLSPIDIHTDETSYSLHGRRNIARASVDNNTKKITEKYTTVNEKTGNRIMVRKGAVKVGGAADGVYFTGDQTIVLAKNGQLYNAKYDPATGNVIPDGPAIKKSPGELIQPMQADEVKTLLSAKEDLNQTQIALDEYLANPTGADFENLDQQATAMVDDVGALLSSNTEDVNMYEMADRRITNLIAQLPADRSSVQVSQLQSMLTAIRERIDILRPVDWSLSKPDGMFLRTDPVATRLASANIPAKGHLDSLQEVAAAKVLSNAEFIARYGKDFDLYNNLEARLSQLKLERERLSELALTKEFIKEGFTSVDGEAKRNLFRVPNTYLYDAFKDRVMWNDDMGRIHGVSVESDGVTPKISPDSASRLTGAAYTTTEFYILDKELAQKMVQNPAQRLGVENEMAKLRTNPVDEILAKNNEQSKLYGEPPVDNGWRPDNYKEPIAQDQTPPDTNNLNNTERTFLQVVAKGLSDIDNALALKDQNLSMQKLNEISLGLDKLKEILPINSRGLLDPQIHKMYQKLNAAIDLVMQDPSRHFEAAYDSFKKMLIDYNVFTAKDPKTKSEKTFQIDHPTGKFNETNFKKLMKDFGAKYDYATLSYLIKRMMPDLTNKQWGSKYQAVVDRLNTTMQKGMVNTSYSSAVTRLADNQKYGIDAFTREQFRDRLRHVWKLPKVQYDAIIKLVDARAEAWARNHPDKVGPGDYYRTHIADIVNNNGDINDLNQTTDLENDPIFQYWFRDSKVVDEKGKPLVVYHGTARSDRVAASGKFDKKRATSGPMQYFTDSAEVGSEYAVSKPDNSLSRETAPIDTYLFNLPGVKKPLTIDQVWSKLDLETKQKLQQNLPYVSSEVDQLDWSMTDMEANNDLTIPYLKDMYDNVKLRYQAARKSDADKYIIGHPFVADEKYWEFEAQRAGGNWIKAAYEIWFNGGNLYGKERDFAAILREAGLDLGLGGIEYHSDFDTYPGVVPVYLSIKNPIDADNVPQNVIDALELAASKVKKSPDKHGVDLWDKDIRDPQEWIQQLKEDVGSGKSLAWTSVPDWATETLKGLGYDGIKDRGGKYSGNEHGVWVPFEETQVKSIFNKGDWDPNDPRILYQENYHGTWTRGIKKISLDYMGAGTGGQLQGWGAYLADLRGVGEYYREVTTRDKNFPKSIVTIDGEVVPNRNQFGAKIEPAQLLHEKIYGKKGRSYYGKGYSNLDILDYVMYKLTVDKVSIDGFKDYFGKHEIDHETRLFRQRIFDMFDLIKDRVKIEDNPEALGQLYQIDNKGTNWMLWDEPLSKQPKEFQDLIAKYKFTKEYIVKRWDNWSDWSNESGEKTTKYAVGYKLAGDDTIYGFGVHYYDDPNSPALLAEVEKARADEDNVRGSTWYRILESHLGSDKAASLAMLAVGIHGNKYKNQLSRGIITDGRELHYNYVVFDENLMDITNTFYQENYEPHFYSKLKQTLTALPSKEMTVADLRKIIQKNSITSDELWATGIEEYLDNLQPGDKINRDQVMAAMMPLNIEEDLAIDGPSMKDENYYQAERDMWDSKRQLRAEIDVLEDRIRKTKKGIFLSDDPEYWLNKNFTPREVDAIYNRYVFDTSVPDWAQSGLLEKFSELSKSNGVGDIVDQFMADSLLRLEYYQTMEDLDNRWDAESDPYLQDNTKYNAYTLPWPKYYREMLISFTDPRGQSYTAPHFDNAQNLMIHARLTDRFTPDGDKILFIEELQSDWHQAGRKSGYYNPADMKNIPQSVPEVVNKYNVDITTDEVTVTSKETGEIVLSFDGEGIDPKYIYQRVLSEFEDSVKFDSEGNKKPPRIPFAETWQNLGLKRLLQYAAENGYHAVGWTTGKQQVDRYSNQIRNQVVEFQYKEDQNNPGAYIINIVPKRGQPSANSFDRKKLAQTFGDDLANRVASDPNAGDGDWHIIPGDEFTVGQKGMKFYYDERFVNYINKFGRNLDASVGTFEIETNPGVFVDVHGVRLTSKMVDRVLAPMELFQAGQKSRLGGVRFLNDGRAVISAFRNANVSTVIHELGHIFRKDITGDDLMLLESWLEVKDGVWSREHEEKFARAFEKYLSDGIAPKPTLKGVFEQFKTWMGEIYRGITGSEIDVEIPTEVRGVFDRLFQYKYASTEIENVSVADLPEVLSNAVSRMAKVMLTEAKNGNRGFQSTWKKSKGDWLIQNTLPPFYLAAVHNGASRESILAALQDVADKTDGTKKNIPMLICKDEIMRRLLGGIGQGKGQLNPIDFEIMDMMSDITPERKQEAVDYMNKYFSEDYNNGEPWTYQELVDQVRGGKFKPMIYDDMPGELADLYNYWMSSSDQIEHMDVMNAESAFGFLVQFAKNSDNVYQSTREGRGIPIRDLNTTTSFGDDVQQYTEHAVRYYMLLRDGFRNYVAMYGTKEIVLVDKTDPTSGFVVGRSWQSPDRYQRYYFNKDGFIAEPDMYIYDELAQAVDDVGHTFGTPDVIKDLGLNKDDGYDYIQIGSQMADQLFAEMKDNLDKLEPNQVSEPKPNYKDNLTFQSPIPEDVFSKNISEVATQPELFGYDGKPMSPEQASARQDAIQGVLDMAKATEDGKRFVQSDLANRMIKNFVETGSNSLVGMEITSTHDLASAAQIYRDPRFETGRYIFMKNGKVVGEKSISQNLPGSAIVLTHEGLVGDSLTEQDIKDYIVAVGADSVYALHNHPSGDPEPSIDDMQLSDHYAQTFPEYKGHIVIDHDRYALITSAFTDPVKRIALATKYQIFDVPGAALDTYDLFDRNQFVLDHSLFDGAGMMVSGPALDDNLKVESPAALLKFAKRVVNNPSQAVIVGTNVRGFIKAIAQINDLHEAFNDLRAIPDIGQYVGKVTEDIGGQIKEWAAKNGVGDAYLVFVDLKNIAPGSRKASILADLLQRRYLRDVLTNDGHSFQQDLGLMPKNDFMFGKPTDAHPIKVREPIPGYDTSSSMRDVAGETIKALKERAGRMDENLGQAAKYKNDAWTKNAQNIKNEAAKLLDDYTNYVNRYGDKPIVRISDRDPNVGSVIFPSQQYPGKFQISYFDADGFISHMIYTDLVDALTETGYGYTFADPAVLDQLVTKQKFADGTTRDLARERGTGVAERQSNYQPGQRKQLPVLQDPKQKLLTGPQGLYQEGGDQPMLPPGGYDQLSGHTDLADLLEEGWLTQAKPFLSAMQDSSKKPTRKFSVPGFDDETQKQLNQYLNDVRDKMAQTKHQAVKYGDMMRDNALLDYGKQYGADKLLNAAVPYQFFMTRSAVNWAARVLDRPAWLSFYARLQRLSNTYKNQYPERMRNKIKIPMANMPDWAGDGVYINPQPQLLPFTMYKAPLDSYTRDQTSLLNNAKWIINDLERDGTISEKVAQDALRTQTGTTWERAVEQARLESETGNSPLDYFGTMFSPALYLTLPYYLATGKKMGDQGFPSGQLPITRTGNALDTAFSGTGLDWLGKAGQMMAAPETNYREANGLNEFGEWGDYYIDRQMSNMAIEGKYSTQEVLIAMVDRSGPIYEEAINRVKYEMGMRNPGFALMYQIGKINNGATFNSIVGSILPSLFPGGLLPPAELEARGLKQEYFLAAKAFEAGNKEAYNKFFDDHPEYQVRLALRKDPQERLEQFLKSSIWDKYGQLGATDKKNIAAYLGEDFKSFMGSEPGVVFAPEKLANWAQMMGAVLPQKAKDILPKNDQGEIAQPYQPMNPEITSVTDQYFKERSELFPNYYTLQAVYFDLPKSDQAKYLLRFPELKKYWSWNDNWKKQYPDLVDYFNGKEFKRVDMTSWSPDAVQMVTMYAMTGQRLSAPAKKLLQNYWEDGGKQYDDFQVWLDSMVVPSILNGNLLFDQ